MKITKDMVGRKVHSPSWGKDEWLLIEHVGKNKFAATDENGRLDIWGLGGDAWVLLPEEKKPSERLLEIICETDRHSCTGILAGIMRYLDEQFEKGSLK